MFAGYAIWDARNRWVFDGDPFACGKVLQRACNLAVSIPGPAAGARVQRALASLWQRPAPGTFKLNFDAAVGSNGGAGLGCVVRDS